MVKQAAASKEVTKDMCELKEFMWVTALQSSLCILNGNPTGNYSPVACIELKLPGNTFTDCMFSVTHWWLRGRKCFVKSSCNNTLSIIWTNPEAIHWCWKLNKICKFFFWGIIDDLQSAITCLKCVSHNEGNLNSFSYFWRVYSLSGIAKVRVFLLGIVLTT